MNIRLCLLLIHLILLPMVNVSAATPSTRQVIDDALAAAGGAEAWQRLGTLSLVGTMKAAGLEGSYSATEDPRTGRWVMSYTLGLLQGGEGYDGTTAWSRTPGGELTVLDASPAREAAVTRAWLVTRSYLLSPGEPATPAAPRTVSEDGRRLLVIDAMPSGGLPIELWFDATTGLLDRTVEKQGAETVTTRYGDYRDVEDVAIAFLRQQSSGDPRADVEIRLEEVTVLPEVDAARFALPAAAPADYRFTGPVAATTVPFELLANHVYVQASLDGRTLRFLLDTGGVNLLTSAAAARLGLESRGEMHGQGAGEGSVSVGLVKIASLTLGDVELSDQTFYVVPLGHVAGEHGAAFDGLLGFEVFSRFVVTLDYAGRQLTLTEPGSFNYSGAGARIPLRFADRIPVIEAAIDGIDGSFSIDTGARNSLTLTSPFVAQHDLIARYEAGRERVVGWGVGGPVVAHVARARELAIGAVHVEWPVTELYTGERGHFASTELAGNIGGGILRRFTAIFAYGRRELILEPNAEFSRPDLMDRSGMMLKRDAKGPIVADVGAETPAQRAGLRAGDRLIGLDGRTLDADSLLPLREQLREFPAGTRLVFAVERDGVMLDLALTLEDLVAPDPREASRRVQRRP